MRRLAAILVLSGLVSGLGSCATAGGGDSALSANAPTPPARGHEAPLIGWLEARGEVHRLSVDEISAQRGIFETYDEMNAQEIDATLHVDPNAPSPDLASAPSW